MDYGFLYHRKSLNIQLICIKYYLKYYLKYNISRKILIILLYKFTT